MRNNKNKGFTLVELLVVIAILAILATVSVVGYTSFIERADVSTDEQLAAQLNNFLVAVKADSNGPFYGEDITEDNIWEVTQYILHDSGLEGKLVPNSAKHGYHFYFDLTDGKYMVLKDNKALAENSGIDKIINLAMKAYAAGEDLHAPGNCFTVDNRYFLVDTEGSNLANVIRQFYTFDEENEDDKFNFTEFYALSQGSDIPTALKALASQSVFVTKEGMFKGEGTLTNIFFHDDEGLQLMETPNITLTEVDGKVAPIVIPANVKYFGIGAINVTVNGTASNAPVIIERYAEELSSCLSEDFTNVNFVLADGKEWQMTIGATGGEYAGTPVITTVEASNVEYPIGGTNTMADFDIFVNASNKSYTSEMENTNGVNVLNVPTIVWHTGSITLGLYEKDIKAEDTTKPVSSKRVKWTLTDNYGPCVQLTEEGVLTFSRGEDGLYPDISSISVTATAVRGETAKTFVINLSRGTDSTVTVDGNVATNNAASVLWGEDASEADGYKNSYTIGATLNTWDANKKDGFTYDSDIVLVENSDLLSADGSVISTTTTILNENTTSTTISFEVIVGGYYKETVTITLNDARLLFTKAHSNLKYIATEGVVKASDFFKQVDEDATYSNVMIHAYLKPTGNQSMSDLETGTLPTPTGVEGDTSHQMDGVWANINSGAFNTAEFDLDLLTNVTTEKTIVFVVTVDGIRASENYEVTVVPGNNVRVDEDLSRTDNNVVLSDFNVDGAADVNDDGMIKVAAGKTFYGNGFTITVTDGILQYNETQGTNGVVALHGTMRDTKVIGEVFTKWMATVGAKYGSATVTSVNDNAKLINCYIANSRSALRVEKDTLVEDCVFFGGRHANIDVISNGTVLTMRGTCITVNQGYTYPNGATQTGTGIAIWWTAGIKPEVRVEDYTKADGTPVEGNLIQYNFISTNDNMPTITTDSLGIDLGSIELIEVDLGIVFDSLINDTTYQQQGFVFTDSTTGTKYVNAGVVYMNKAESEVVTPTGFSGYGMTSYLFNAAKAFPSTERCPNNFLSGKGHGQSLCTHHTLFKTAMDKAIGREDMNVVCYSMKSTSENGAATFANYSTATAKYNYSAWNFDSNGNIIHD